MVSLEFREGITETLDILNHMDKSYIDKIPKKFKDFLEKNQSQSYIPNLDHSKKIHEMALKEKTKDILATIYINYWCSNAEQKENYIKTLQQNEEKYQEKLREKYNPDNIFKNKNQTTIQPKHLLEDNVSLIDVKENFFTRFVRKIKDIFHIK